LTQKPQKEEQIARFVEYWNVLSTKEQAVVRDEVQKKVDARMTDWEKEAAR